MAAKKKAAKKKVTRKPAKKTTKRVVRKSKPMAGTMEMVKPPVVDVTEEVKQDVVAVPPPMPVTQTTMPEKEAAAKHEEFTQSLTQEPPKRGFWARLFGKK